MSNPRRDQSLHKLRDRLPSKPAPLTPNLDKFEEMFEQVQKSTEHTRQKFIDAGLEDQNGRQLTWKDWRKRKS